MSVRILDSEGSRSTAFPPGREVRGGKGEGEKGITGNKVMRKKRLRQSVMGQDKK